ncbi:MAG: hypothetical protein U0174_23140 [Polyangiaceae bacterium]
MNTADKRKFWRGKGARYFKLLIQEPRGLRHVGDAVHLGQHLTTLLCPDIELPRQTVLTLVLEEGPPPATDDQNDAQRGCA